MNLHVFAANKQLGGRPIAPYIDEVGDQITGFTRSSALSGAIAPLMDALCANPKAVALEFCSHSRAETFGAAFIESAAKVCSDGVLRAALDAHASDEYRHGRMFRALAERLGETFPTETEQPDEARFRADDAGAFTGNMGAFMCSTHVAEIRSLCLLGAFLEAARALPKTLKPRITSILERVHDDEMRHAEYSGDWVQRYLNASEISPSYIAECFAVYERDLWANLSTISAHLHQGWSTCTDDAEKLTETLGARLLVTKALTEAAAETSPALEAVLTAVERNHPALALAAYRAVEKCLIADTEAHSKTLFSDGDEERCGVGLIRTLRTHLPGLTQAEITQLDRHEADEIRHAHMYDSYACRLRGGRGVTGLEIDSLDPIDDLGPDFTPEHAGELLLSLHLGEVHNLQRLRQRIMALEDGPVDQPWLIAGLKSIAADEVRHVASTATLLDRLLIAQPDLRNSIAIYARQYGGSWWSDIGVMTAALSGESRARYSA